MEASAAEKVQEWQLLDEFSDHDGKPFKMAMGITQCPNGDFVIADPVAIRVGIFTSSGTFKTNLNSDDDEDGKFFMPSDVAVTSEGQIIVVDKSPLVKVYDFESGHFTFAFKTVHQEEGHGEIHVCPAAVQVYRDKDIEHVFILDILRKVLTCHEKDGTDLKSIDTGGTPSYFSVINAKQFILSDYSDGKVRFVDSDSMGNYKTTVVIDTPMDGLGRKASPVGSCIDKQTGNFYLALGKRQGDCMIQSYEVKSGKFVSCIASKLNNPFNMIISVEGNLVVADKRKIKIYKPPN